MELVRLQRARRDGQARRRGVARDDSAASGGEAREEHADGGGQHERGGEDEDCEHQVAREEAVVAPQREFEAECAQQRENKSEVRDQREEGAHGGVVRGDVQLDESEAHRHQDGDEQLQQRAGRHQRQETRQEQLPPEVDHLPPKVLRPVTITKEAEPAA